LKGVPVHFYRGRKGIIILPVTLATSAKVKPQVGVDPEPELPACEAGAD